MACKMFRKFKKLRVLYKMPFFDIFVLKKKEKNYFVIIKKYFIFLTEKEKHFCFGINFPKKEKFTKTITRWRPISSAYV